MATESILVVDDEAVQREVLAGFLRKKGYRVTEACSMSEAVERFETASPDLVLTDFRMPGGSGLDVLKGVRAANPEVPVVLITAYGTIESAVEAMREGAFDYISKPVKLEALERVVGNAVRHRRVRIENRALTESGQGPQSLPGMVARSREMQEAVNVASRAAGSDATVLILGETGTGKEVIARAIHGASGRGSGPFVPVNCAALAEGILESELFGHEKGAFTGAQRRRAGRFEEAAGGTLFLDEVGDIPAAVQVKLLRVVQDGEFERVGSSTPVRADVRLIGATHQDLEAMVKEGRFRADLFYRLNVIPIRLPALRNRRDDIPALAERFLQSYAEKNTRTLIGLSREAMDALVRYDYPGNVRELENAIERAAVMARGEMVGLQDLPDAIQAASGPASSTRPRSDGSLPDRLEAIERKAIVDAMQQAGGVQSQAARVLGINERNLRYKLKKYGLK